MLQIQENISLKNYNTFHIDVKARFFVDVKSQEEFAELMETEIWSQYPHFFLGGGANILFTKNYPGIIIKVSLMGKEVVGEYDDHISIKVGAGESWPAFVNRCVEQGYQGLENLALIPGTVGASAVGNIGAYGTEAKDVIEEVECIMVNGECTMQTIKNAECKFAYRESIFKHALKDKVLITGVTFALKKVADTAPLKKAVADIVAQRQSKLPDPTQIGTAGSFFKNPIITEKVYLELKEKYPELISFPVQATGEIKLSAGQLIELCGLKGYTQGNVGVSKNHALILINLGGGTGIEMMQLATHIVSEVEKKFNIGLEPEVIYM